MCARVGQCAWVGVSGGVLWKLKGPECEPNQPLAPPRQRARPPLSDRASGKGRTGLGGRGTEGSAPPGPVDRPRPLAPRELRTEPTFLVLVRVRVPPAGARSWILPPALRCVARQPLDPAEGRGTGGEGRGPGCSGCPRSSLLQPPTEGASEEAGARSPPESIHTLHRLRTPGVQP